MIVALHFIHQVNSCDCCCIAGSDYESVTRMLTFPAGQTELLVPVDTMEDIIAENRESFEATLSRPSAGLNVGNRDSAIVNIVDNDREESLNIIMISFQLSLPPSPLCRSICSV